MNFLKVANIDELIKKADAVAQAKDQLLQHLDTMGENIANVASMNEKQPLDGAAIESVYKVSEFLNALRDEISAAEINTLLPAAINALVNNIDHELNVLEGYSNTLIDSYLNAITLIFANQFKPALAGFFVSADEAGETQRLLTYTDTNEDIWDVLYTLDENSNPSLYLGRNLTERNQKLFDTYDVRDTNMKFNTMKALGEFVELILTRASTVEKRKIRKKINKTLKDIENIAIYRINDYRDIDKKSEEETLKTLIIFLNDFIDAPEYEEQREQIRKKIPEYARKLIQSYY